MVEELCSELDDMLDGIAAELFVAPLIAAELSCETADALAAEATVICSTCAASADAERFTLVA